MVLGVEDHVADALALEQLRQQLGFFDGDGTNQHRLALGMALLDLLDDRAKLARLGLVDHVGVVLADHRLVGGDLDHVQGVDALKFLQLGHGRAGHAGELAVQTEEVLEGDGRKSLALACDLHALLGLNGLMQALIVAAAIHQSARGFVYDDDLSVLDHVVHVPLHEAAGTHGLVDVVRKRGVFKVCQVFNVEIFLCLADALGGELHRTGFFIHVVVAVVVVVGFFVVGGGIDLPLEAGDEEIGHLIELGAVVALAGDDQRRSGLVDQDGVHLVDDGKAVAALDLVFFIQRHVVAQIVEAKLVVGAIGNVGQIRLPPLIGGHIVDDQTDLQAHEAIDLAHPLRVSLGKIVVDGDDVHALALEGVEVGGQNGDQGFALAGLHLGNAALVQNDAADELDPVRPHAQNAPRGLPHGGKRLGQKIVQRLAVCKPLFEFNGFMTQILV